jgi:hypothetical protein
MKTLKWLVYLLIVMCVSVIIVLCLAFEEPVYQTGTLTKGNPDNSYLDSCEVYCCGD